MEPRWVSRVIWVTLAKVGDCPGARIVLKGRLMDCSTFLKNYSDFLDRRLEAYPLAAYREHLLSCGACARYDRVIQSGLCLVREIEPAEPTTDFEPRLQHRFFDLQEVLKRREAALAKATSAAMLSMAVILVAVSLPALATDRTTIELPPVVIEEPASSVAPSGVVSFFGLAPSVAATTSPLLLPDFPEGAWLTRPPGRLSLFRQSLGAGTPRQVVDEPEEESTE